MLFEQKRTGQEGLRRLIGFKSCIDAIGADRHRYITMANQSLTEVSEALIARKRGVPWWAWPLKIVAVTLGTSVMAAVLKENEGKWGWV